MLKGKPAGESDIVTMRAIRSILIEHEDQSNAATAMLAGLTRRQPDAAPRAVETPPPTLQPVREIEAKVNMAKFTTVPNDEAPVLDAMDQDAPAETPRAKRRVKLPFGRRKGRGKSRATSGLLRRFTPRAGAIAVLFGLAMVQPGLLIYPLLGTLALVLGAFVLFGADRVWGAVGRALARYERRSPKRAARLLDRLDVFAVYWDAVLDRFPDGSVDGLYMPDFANYDAFEESHQAKLDDRFAQLRQQG